MTALLEVFWKSGAILGAALLITLLLRKRSADARRLVLSAAVVAMFLAALAAPLLPRLAMPEPRWLAAPATTPTAATPTLITAGIIARSTPPQSMSTPAAPPPAQFPEPIPLIWFLGTALLLTRLGAGLYGLRRMRRTAHPIGDDDRLLQSDRVVAPVTWGIIHPVILVPAGFEQLPEESREAVLCHELAHIQGCDFLLRMLAEIARAVVWFQPLMWIAARHLREEQELACDDRVLASGVKPSAYAKLLLDWDFTPATPAIGMASGGSLKRRLYALLDADTRRGRTATALVFSAWILAVAAALPLAAMSWTRPTNHVASEKRSVQESAAPLIPAPARPKNIRIAQAQRPPKTPAPVAAIPPAALYVTSSILVIEDVTVINSEDGKPVEGLTAGDFEIMEDGKQQRPAFVEPQNAALVQFQGNGLQLSQYYVLGYYSTNSKTDGAYRSVKVSLKNAGAKLDYRAGYYARSMTPTGTYTPVTMPAGVAAPELVAKAEPAYSDEARKAKYSGTVTLNAVVDESGKPTNIVVTQPLGFGLDENAVQALQRWRFRPASQNGVPVSAPVRIEMSFYVL
jgi:TonB family protein